MNQLGIIYRLTASEQGKGFDAYLIEINKDLDGGWSHVVVDERELWFAAGMEANHGVAVTILSTGVVLTMSRLTHGQRPTDNMTVWVYVPAALSVTPQQWAAIIAEMERIVNLSQLPTAASFAPLVNMEFARRRYTMALTPSDVSMNNRKVAYRITNGVGGMATLLDAIDQAYYAPYRHLFLYPRQPAGLQIAMDNLTDRTASKSIVAIPPIPQAIISAFGYPDVRVTYNGSPFDRPIAVSSPNLKLEAHRPGYASQPFTAIVTSPDQPVTVSVTKMPWDVKVSRNGIRVVDANGKNIDSLVQVAINNKVIRPNDAIRIPEREASSVKISIKGNGYEEVNETVQLSRLSQPFVLKSREETASTAVYIDDDEGKKPVRLNVAVSGTNLRKLGNQKITVELSNGTLKEAQNSFNQGLLFGIVGTVVSLLIGVGIYFGCSSLFGGKSDDEGSATTEVTNEITNESVAPQPTEPKVESKSNEEAARHYLNEECKTTKGDDWCLNREVMANYPELNGLFDMVNTLDVEGLAKSKFSDTEPIRRVIQALQTVEDRLTTTKIYNKPGDPQIQISNYTKSITSGDFFKNTADAPSRPRNQVDNNHTPVVKGSNEQSTTIQQGRSGGSSTGENNKDPRKKILGNE